MLVLLMHSFDFTTSDTRPLDKTLASRIKLNASVHIRNFTKLCKLLGLHVAKFAICSHEVWSPGSFGAAKKFGVLACDVRDDESV